MAAVAIAAIFFVGRWGYGVLFSTDILAEGVVGRPRYINPLLARSEIDQRLSEMIYRGLIRYNENFEPQPDLAENWSVSEDSKTYTVILKTKQFWHDGELITADDVIFTYEQMPEFEAVTIEKIDDTTVKFSLPQPLSSFVELLSTGILPQHRWQDQDLRTSELNLKPIGSGGYKFNSIDIDNNSIKSLTLNIQQSAISSHKFTFYNETADLITAYKLGEIDRFETTDETVANEFASWPNSDVQTGHAPSLAKPILFFNLRTETSPVADVEIRRALAQKLKDTGVTIASPLPPPHWAHATYSITTSDVDISQKTFKVLFLPSTRPYINKLQNVFGENTFKVSEGTFPPSLEWDTLIAPLTFPHDPDQYAYWHSSQAELGEGRLNISGYKNRRVDKALEDGRKTTDREARKNAYDTVQRWLAEDVPAIFLEPPTTHRISRQR